MLKTPTLEKLERLGLLGIMQAFEEQIKAPDLHAPLAFEERVAMLVDREESHRGNKQLARRLKNAKLRHEACVEDIDLKQARSLDKNLLSALATCEFIKRHQNILLTGPTGVGKSYIACALSHRACLQGYSAVYYRSTQLFQEIARARANGKYHAFMSALSKVNLLVIDDWGLQKLNDDERSDLLEVLEDRHDRRSTIVTSQIPVEKWFDVIGNPTLADAILDRLVHNAHRLNLSGPSMRKLKIKQNAKEEGK